MKRPLTSIIALAAAFAAGAAEIELNDIRTVTGYATYTSGDIISGTGGFLVKNGGVLRDRKSVV